MLKKQSTWTWNSKEAMIEMIHVDDNEWLHPNCTYANTIQRGKRRWLTKRNSISWGCRIKIHRLACRCVSFFQGDHVWLFYFLTYVNSYMCIFMSRQCLHSYTFDCAHLSHPSESKCTCSTTVWDRYPGVKTAHSAAPLTYSLLYREMALHCNPSVCSGVEHLMRSYPLRVHHVPTYKYAHLYRSLDHITKNKGGTWTGISTFADCLSGQL